MKPPSELISQLISQSPVDGNSSVNVRTREKTWQRTKTPGLLKHKSGRYYGRFTVGGKTRFEPLKTDLADIAKIRFSEVKAKVERTRKAARNAAEGAASMGDLTVIARQRIAERAGVSERTRELNRDAVGFLERTWDGFAKLRPDQVTPTSVAIWRDRALATGTGHRPPGSHTEKKGASASSVNKAISALSLMLDAAVDMEVIHGNPLARRRGLKASDKPHKPKLPEQADLERLFVETRNADAKETDRRVTPHRRTLSKRIAIRAAKVGVGVAGGAYIGKKLGTAAGATTGAVAGLLFQSKAARNASRAGITFAARIQSHT